MLMLGLQTQTLSIIVFSSLVIHGYCLWINTQQQTAPCSHTAFSVPATLKLVYYTEHQELTPHSQKLYQMTEYLVIISYLDFTKHVDLQSVPSFLLFLHCCRFKLFYLRQYNTLIYQSLKPIALLLSLFTIVLLTLFCFLFMTISF